MRLGKRKASGMESTTIFYRDRRGKQPERRHFFANSVDVEYNTLFCRTTGRSREMEMRKPRQVGRWVVYRMTLHGEAAVMAVCEQSEWEELERERPGYHTLVQAGIASEPEAERLARGTSGDRVIRLRARL
jgi:hypothetical protein